MQGLEITLKRNKQYEAENSEEFLVISGENNATSILVHFPEEYWIIQSEWILTMLEARSGR